MMHHNLLKTWRVSTMPQARKELVERWGGEDGIGEDKAVNYLIRQGWKEVGFGLWRSPVEYFELMTAEKEALEFLIDEWDHAYGGKIKPLP